MGALEGTKVVFTSSMLYSRAILLRVGLGVLAGVSEVKEANFLPYPPCVPSPPSPLVR